MVKSPKAGYEVAIFYEQPTIVRIREVLVMKILEQKQLDNADRDLLQSIDRGIEDMKAGRELTVEEAFRKITELRNERRRTRA